jgi:hypothetical protein
MNPIQMVASVGDGRPQTPLKSLMTLVLQGYFCGCGGVQPAVFAAVEWGGVGRRALERVIGSIRRECLDHVIVMNAAGLHRVLRDYVAYYIRSRTHLALGKDTPSPRRVTPPSAGRIVALPEVGGLHHRYDRIAV